MAGKLTVGVVQEPVRRVGGAFTLDVHLFDFLLEQIALVQEQNHLQHGKTKAPTRE